MSTVRDTYLSDYNILEQEARELLKFCRTADKGQQAMILHAAQIANDSIAIPIFVNLTSGIGYDRLSMWYEIPMQRKDFQGYRRKGSCGIERLTKITSGRRNEIEEIAAAW